VRGRRPRPLARRGRQGGSSRTRFKAGKGAQSAPAWPGRRGPGRPHPVRVTVEGEQVLVVLLLRAAAGRQRARPGQAALDAVLLDPAERTRAWARPRHARRAGSAVARRAVRRERGENPPAQGGAPCFCRGDRGAGPCFRGGAPAIGSSAAAQTSAELRVAAATRTSSAAPHAGKSAAPAIASFAQRCTEEGAALQPVLRDREHRPHARRQVLILLVVENRALDPLLGGHWATGRVALVRLASAAALHCTP